MKKTIGQLETGTSVYIKENGVPKEYILLKKDEDGCIVLRAKAIKARGMNKDRNAIYEGSDMDVWLCNEEDGFLSLFDDQTRAAIIPRSRPTYEYGDEACHYIVRRAFLLTYGELFQEEPNCLEPLTSIVSELMKWRGTSDEYDARVAYNEDGQAVYWWESSPCSGSAFYCVNYYGASNYNAATLTSWARPALNVSSDTIVSDEGAEIIYLQPENHSEAGYQNSRNIETTETVSIICDLCGHLMRDITCAKIRIEAPITNGTKSIYKFRVCTKCKEKVVASILLTRKEETE